MKDNPQKKQQFNLFIKELFAFALIFISLGFVIYFFFNQSIYKNIDHSLNFQKTQLIHPKQPKQQQRPMQPQFTHGRNFSQGPSVNSPFRTTQLVFNKKGKIENSASIGNRNFKLLNTAQLDKRTVNKVLDMSLSYDGIVSHFRSLLIKIPNSNTDKRVAGKYVLLLENVDSDLLAINSFKNSLVATLLIFWLLAIIVAFLLSRSSMKPILKSWQRQSEFSSNAAHELRTPLTVIQNQMETLLTKPKDTIMNQVEAVSTTLDETKHLKILTDRLLMLSRSDSNIIQINRQSTPIKPWLTNIIRPYKEIAISQQKHFEERIQTDSSANIDADLIHQLLTIIFDNAFKYTKASDTISISATNNEHYLTIKISNSGPSISDEDKSHIFDRFYRTDKSRASSTGGYGLGLSIAKWIVNEHHGRISVRDLLPHGIVFSIQIPLH